MLLFGGPLSVDHEHGEARGAGGKSHTQKRAVASHGRAALCVGCSAVELVTIEAKGKELWPFEFRSSCDHLSMVPWQVAIDGWLRFEGAPRVGVLVRELRQLLRQLLLRKIADPSLDVGNSAIIEALCTLILSDGH